MTVCKRQRDINRERDRERERERERENKQTEKAIIIVRGRLATELVESPCVKDY